MQFLPPIDRTGRRSYKSKQRMRDGSKEAVWPPELEEALLEGLRMYRPVSKTGRPLRRFTKRNCFIANYIKEHTSQSRTPKQVGSRLQQLTESCKDEEIIRLITNRDLHFHPRPENHASPDDSSVHGSVVNSSALSSGPTPANAPALSRSSTISDLDSSEAWSQQYQPEHTDNVILLMSLNSLDKIGNTPQIPGIGLHADTSDNGTSLVLTIDHRHNDRICLQIIPSRSLFDRAPDLSIASTVLAPGISYASSFSVYFDGEFIHSETGELVAVKDEYPSNGCTIKTTLLSNDSWHQVVRRDVNLERYTIVLDIMDTILCTRINLFSVDITLKPTTDVNPHYPSTVAFYPNAFEGSHFSHDFPVCPSSNVLEFTLQSHSDFQTGSGTPSWNIPNQFAPTADFVPYPSFDDAQLMAIPEPVFPHSYCSPV
ncbi:hypothetical protein M413DRAFT_13473 [Hebeloma cylindrosporum]|uniref:TEA domain-containing protein n=1 Tax=Hebeloma cylindrosporum TaxID=76867 RepID=A0A0C2XHI5_HEBCY|nr:hypothetical protein M413DRAFT_13473 [Hebeloma cylindrosporum h7]